MKNPVGRPKKATERKVSVSVSILPSELKRVEKRYSSLTKFIEAMLFETQIKTLKP